MRAIGSFKKGDVIMLIKIRNLLRNKKGQGFVEYALVISGVVIVVILATRAIGSKSSNSMSVAALI